MSTCPRCDGCGWVCENHPDRPWQGQHACECGGDSHFQRAGFSFGGRLRGELSEGPKSLLSQAPHGEIASFATTHAKNPAPFPK
jgi:hypothetical protein